VLALCAVGSLLASAGGDLRVRLWDPATGDPVATIGVRDLCVDLVADGSTLILGTWSGVQAYMISEPFGSTGYADWHLLG
jgi:hypothetical protein